MTDINKSKTYILPLLDGYIDIGFLHQIIDTFLFNVDTLEVKRAIHILYDEQVQEDPIFNSYYVSIHHSKYFIESHTTKYGPVLSFAIPEEHHKDYDNFLKGNYSKYHESSKQKVLHHLYRNYPNLYSVVKIVEQILYRDQTLRHVWEEQLKMGLPVTTELSSKVDLDSETFSLSTYSE